MSGMAIQRKVAIGAKLLWDIAIGTNAFIEYTVYMYKHIYIYTYPGAILAQAMFGSLRPLARESATASFPWPMITPRVSGQSRVRVTTSGPWPADASRCRPLALGSVTVSGPWPA